MTGATGSTLPGDSTPTDFLIAGVRFDAARNQLRNGTGSRHLAPRESGVLAALLHGRRGAVVSRAQLLDSVWCEHDVGDEALTVIVSRLRRHFRLLGVKGPVIETVPKVGYRLIAEPGVPRVAGDDIALPGKADTRARIALYVAVIALGIALVDLIL